MMPACISDVFVRTSTRRREIALDIDLRGIAGADTVQFTAILLDEAGREERCFSTQAAVQAAEAQTITLAWPWPDPRLWDLEQPNLYVLRLSAQGCGLDPSAAYTQTFGFREFWIEGRRFFLNGAELRLRPVLAANLTDPQAIEAAIAGYRWAGFNIAEIWPGPEAERSAAVWCDVADRLGWAMTGPAGHVWDALKGWDDPAVRAAYEERTVAELRRARNHPSLLMWGTNGNVFGSSLGMDPRTIGRRRDAWHDAAYWRKRRAAIGDAVTALIKRCDPTRPVFMHHGGGVGDVYTLNMYLNLIPLQEREEWLSAWAADGELPFMVVEFGTPLHVTFMRGRTDFPGAVVTEPWLTEFCAIYLGREAYALETPAYRADIRDRFIGGQAYRSWHFNPHFDFAPAMQRVQALFSRNTWRSWRTAGITGGMLPWNDGHGWEVGPHLGAQGIQPAGRAIREANSATLAWIAGPSACVTARDHSFRAGQRVEKQVVLINDTRSAQPYRFDWQATVGDAQIAAGDGSGTIEPAQTIFHPLVFTAPDSLQEAKAGGSIRLTAAIGGQELADEFDFRVFASPVNPQILAIHTHDPRGETRGLLASLGYPVRDWAGELDAALVVIGRRALSDGAALPGNLETYVRQGGRALIFTQDPAWLRRVGFRVAPHVTRRVYPVQADHPILAGLDAADLRDWAGESTLVEAYPPCEPGTTRLGKWWFPYHGYHWGNRGGVSSAAVEKPHRAGWRPILECEFDLAYSPLMELDYGAGRLVLCTLDLEEHAAAEPVAELLARRIVAYAATAPLAPRAVRTILLGDDRDAQRLDALGVLYERQRDPSPCPSLCKGEGRDGSELLIVGSGARPNDAWLMSFLVAGGRALFLPCEAPDRSSGIILEHVAAFSGSLDIPGWRECRGLSPSDLRWRADHDAWLITSKTPPRFERGASGLLARLQVGPGVALFCQNDPDRFDADAHTCFRFTRWRATRALAQLLANLGASFTMDAAFFAPPDQPRIELAGPWRALVRSQADLPPAPSGNPRPDGAADIGTPAEVAPEADDATWDEIVLPQPWERLGGRWLATENEVILRRTVEIPADWLGHDLLLSLGKVDDSEHTYFSGVRVDELEPKAPWPHNFPRVYTIPARLVRPGPNVIAVHIFDRMALYDRLWGGGFIGPAGELFLQPITAGFYHRDYRADYVYGDDPYRYFNW